MPRNKAVLDLLDELSDGPRPRHVTWCVVCGNPIKSVNGVALCGVSVHPTYCMAEHVATCPKCKKEMEDHAKKQETNPGNSDSTAGTAAH